MNPMNIRRTENGYQIRLTNSISCPTQWKEPFYLSEVEVKPAEVSITNVYIMSVYLLPPPYSTKKKNQTFWVSHYN